MSRQFEPAQRHGGGAIGPDIARNAGDADDVGAGILQQHQVHQREAFVVDDDLAARLLRLRGRKGDEEQRESDEQAAHGTPQVACAA